MHGAPAIVAWQQHRDGLQQERAIFSRRAFSRRDVPGFARHASAGMTMSDAAGLAWPGGQGIHFAVGYAAQAGWEPPICAADLSGIKFGRMSGSREYPDITDILAQKARGRRERASLSFAEKLAILDKLRADLAPIVQARQARAREHATPEAGAPPGEATKPSRSSGAASKRRDG
jgi:hypothetical protein